MDIKKSTKLIPYEDDDYLWGFKDSNGKIIIPAQFDEVYSFQEDLYPVKLNEKWAL